MEALRAAREELCDALRVEIASQVRFYADLGAGLRAAIAERVVDFFLEMFAEYRSDASRAWALEVFSRRKDQGATLPELLLAMRLVRRVFARRVLDTAHEPAAAAEIVERLDDVCDDIVEVIVQLFQSGRDDARTAVEALEAHYEALYLHTPAMMHAIDAQGGRIIAVSDRWLEVLGYARDEVLGRRSVDFLTEASRKHVLESGLPHLRQEGRHNDQPRQFVKKNGEVLDVLLSSIAVRDEQGQVTRFHAVLVDVTERRRAERAQRESEERWRTLAELAPLPLAVHRDGILLWANAATATLLGATEPHQFLGLNMIALVHPDDRAMVIERVQRGKLSDEALPPLEERFQRLDGTFVHVEIAAQPIMYGGERATQLAIVDVTARRKAEEAERKAAAQAEVIRAQEEMLRALSTPLIPLGEGAIVMPLVGRITGERAERILEALAEGVVKQQARVAIVDVTGVPVMDAAVADALARATRAIRLLGADVVLTGLGPGAARTLVEIGADLGGIATRGTLRDGIFHALGAFGVLGRRGAVPSERLDQRRRAR
jgi:rsbT co-antagonist protein RsbR